MLFTPLLINQLLYALLRLTSGSVVTVRLFSRSVSVDQCFCEKVGDRTQSAKPVRTAHISVLLTVSIVSHNPAWSSSDNIRS